MRAHERARATAHSHRHRPARAAVLALLLATWGGRANAGPSVPLTDVIKSNGVGTIDLFKNITASQLETFRSESSGLLLFAVDVNEAANGTEKASSQGVALDSVHLDVTSGGVVRSYGSFSTDTQALLARAGETSRVPYYTLIGTTGTNRNGAKNSIQSGFDAVIRVPIADSLAGVTAAVLHVRLLDTNVALGDPEAFYDFSNGFEALSLVNLEDAQYLSTLSPGQSEAPAVIQVASTDTLVTGWVSHPSATEFYTVAYEDLYPVRGDYDFNDLVASYRVDVGLNEAGRVARLKGTAYLLARGAGYTHDWHLRVRVPGASPSGTITVRSTDPSSLAITTTSSPFSGDIDVLAFIDTRKLLPPQPDDPFTNTKAGGAFIVSPRVDFSIQLDASIAQGELADAPFDPFIEIRGGGYEVHLAAQPPRAGSRNAAEGLLGFRDPFGYPFAMLTPLNWSYPLSGVDLGLAYPDLSLWVSSGEQQAADWYTRPRQNKVRSYNLEDWSWIPPP